MNEISSWQKTIREEERKALVKYSEWALKYGMR